MTALEDLVCAPGEEAWPFEDGYTCGPADLPMLDPLPEATPTPVASTPVASSPAVGVADVPVLAETGADVGGLLFVAAALILAGFVASLLSLLNHYGVLEDRRPRIKRTP